MNVEKYKIQVEKSYYADKIKIYDGRLQDRIVIFDENSMRVHKDG